jgi:sulfite reductase alpha subunit-like flavoprotein
MQYISTYIACISGFVIVVAVRIGNALAIAHTNSTQQQIAGLQTLPDTVTCESIMLLAETYKSYYCTWSNTYYSQNIALRSVHCMQSMMKHST